MHVNAWYKVTPQGALLQAILKRNPQKARHTRTKAYKEQQARLKQDGAVVASSPPSGQENGAIDPPSEDAAALAEVEIWEISSDGEGSSPSLSPQGWLVVQKKPAHELFCHLFALLSCSMSLLEYYVFFSARLVKTHQVKIAQKSQKSRQILQQKKAPKMWFELILGHSLCSPFTLVTSQGGHEEVAVAPSVAFGGVKPSVQLWCWNVDMEHINPVVQRGFEYYSYGYVV